LPEIRWQSCLSPVPAKHERLMPLISWENMQEVNVGTL
jgi:hypothetical protein